MGLQRFERGLERLVEGTFAKVFRSGLQPIELGRRLAREMDLRRTVGVNGLVAPNSFHIALSQNDTDRFSSYSDALQRELVEAVKKHARSEHYNFLGPVSVELHVDSSLSNGMFLVSSEIEGLPDGGPVGVLSVSDGRRITLSDEPVVIGRLPECDIAINDANVSRRHAEVRRLGNEYIVVDLKSTNGTRVNGLWVTNQKKLRDGDEIVVGSTIIRFEGS